MNIGDSLQHFELKNIDGNIVSTYHMADKSALLVVVTCNHCPYAQAYWPRLIHLAKQYEEDNLGVLESMETTFPYSLRIHLMK